MARTFKDAMGRKHRMSEADSLEQDKLLVATILCPVVTFFAFLVAGGII